MCAAVDKVELETLLANGATGLYDSIQALLDDRNTKSEALQVCSDSRSKVTKLINANLKDLLHSRFYKDASTPDDRVRAHLHTIKPPHALTPPRRLHGRRAAGGAAS